METEKSHIAILSPSKSAYSETFIEAHKTFLEGNIFYYYGGLNQLKLAGKENTKLSGKKIFYKLERKIFNKSFSWIDEQVAIESFKKQKIEAVLAEYGPTAQQFLPVIKALNLPLIVHFHGFDASVRGIIEANRNYSEVFDYASYVVVVSKKMYSDLKEMGCPVNKLVYNVYGPHPDFFEVKPIFSRAQFIAVGRFVDKKAPYYDILAFKKVVKDFPDAVLVMAGDGPLLNTCKNLVKFLQLEKNVEFPGVINRQQFIQFLTESMAFVQHSITADNGDAEGTPVALLEAAAAALPVIATFHAGIPDVIANDRMGFLVEEHDVEAMADKMKNILTNRELARSLGEKSRENIIKNFTLERSIATLNKLLREAQAKRQNKN